MSGDISLFALLKSQQAVEIAKRFNTSETVQPPPPPIAASAPSQPTARPNAPAPVPGSAPLTPAVSLSHSLDSLNPPRPVQATPSAVVAALRASVPSGTVPSAGYEATIARLPASPAPGGGAAVAPAPSPQASASASATAGTSTQPASAPIALTLPMANVGDKGPVLSSISPGSTSGGQLGLTTSPAPGQAFSVSEGVGSGAGGKAPTDPTLASRPATGTVPGGAIGQPTATTPGALPGASTLAVSGQGGESIPAGAPAQNAAPAKSGPPGPGRVTPGTPGLQLGPASPPAIGPTPQPLIPAMPPPQARTGGPFPVPQAGPMPAAVLATPQPHGSQTLPTSLHTPTEGRSTRIGTESHAPLATNPTVPRAVHTPLGDTRPAQREIAAAADSAAVPRTNTTPPDVVRAALALLHSVEGTSASQAAFSFESRAAAAGVILNAAMIPGWPFPSAFARDTPRFEAAALRELGQNLVAMTPEELAEYIAKIGGDHRLLRRIRRFLKQIDGEEGEMAMGFLAMLGAALGQIARALSLPMALAAEEIAQLAGSPEDDGNPLRPGPGGPRRRLRL